MGLASKVYWQPHTSGLGNAASISMYSPIKNRAEIFRLSTKNKIVEVEKTIKLKDNKTRSEITIEREANQPSYSFFLGDEKSFGGTVIVLVEHNRKSIRFYDTKYKKYYENAITMQDDTNGFNFDYRKSPKKIIKKVLHIDGYTQMETTYEFLVCFDDAIARKYKRVACEFHTLSRIDKSVSVYVKQPTELKLTFNKMQRKPVGFGCA